MERHAFTIGNRQLVNGNWVEFTGVEIPMPNHNGVGISMYEELLVIDDDRLVNPATQDVLYRTRKDVASGERKHYFSKATGVFVNAWLFQEMTDEQDG